MFEQIIEQVEKSNNIIIFPHTNMDGDSVGSAKALALALLKLNKKVCILADESVPRYVNFLDSDLFVTSTDIIPDLCFAVDCSDNQRIEKRLDVFNSAPIRVCIDHHPGKEGFAEYIYRDEKSPAAALLVYGFIKALGVAFDKDIAEALYTGILTDTGAFKYDNTNAETHLAVADLMGYGIDHAAICNHVFDTIPYKQLLIESEATKNVKMIQDGKAAISYVTYDFWNQIGAEYSNTETAIDVIRKIDTVEIAAILKEKEPGEFKLSMRSKNYADVSVIASNLGGGGHIKAAACTLKMSLNDAIKHVEDEICKAL